MNDQKCRTCRYSFQADVGVEREMLRACAYILHTGRRRPCPAGERCVVYRSAGREPARGEARTREIQA